MVINHIRNLYKQYQHDDVCVCGTSEECLEEWGCFRQYMHDNYLNLKLVLGDTENNTIRYIDKLTFTIIL